MSIVSDPKFPADARQAGSDGAPPRRKVKRTASWVEFDCVVRARLERLTDGEVLVVAPAEDDAWWLSFLRHDGALLAECVGWGNASRMRTLGWQPPAGHHARDVMWINASGVWETGGQERRPLTPTSGARVAFTTLRDSFGLRSPRSLVIYRA